MHHIDGIDRDQITMFPEALDDYIHEDNPVRFVDAFVRLYRFADWKPGSLFTRLSARHSCRHRTSSVPSRRPSSSLHLRVSQPRPLKPQAGEGDQPQRGIDVASAPPHA